MFASGAGGFGGGGASSFYGVSGNGGFGAGNGGAGSGNENHFSFGGGGGGLGAGGDVFVQQGGTLTIEGGDPSGSVTMSGGSVIKGNGGAVTPVNVGGVSTAGSNGSAFGTGIFIQGNQTVTFAPAANKTLTISDVITDQTANGGTGPNAGAGSLAVNGVGTVKLNAINTYTGGTTIEAGTLELSALGAAGTRAITFSASAATLTVDNAALASGGAGVLTFTGNTIKGFALGDAIDLSGATFSSAANPPTLGAGNLLQFTENGTTYKVQFDPTQTFSTGFQLASDSGGGTQVSLVSGPADLSVTKTDGVTTVVPGTTDTYTFTVTNNGPSTVSSLTLADVVPSALLNPVFGTPSAGSYNSATGLWSGLSLASGQSVTITLSGTIDPAATGSISNTATVSPPAGVTDPTPGNNSATDTDTLTPQADLSITKTDGKTTCRAGHSDHLHDHGRPTTARARSAVSP